MRILADENISGKLVEELRQRGHDVTWVRTDAPASSDEAIVEWACAEQRVILTSDKDFGELAFRHRLPTYCGVILLRLSNLPPHRYVSKAVSAIEGQSDWSGHFAVITDRRVRIRPLPGSAS